MNTAFAEPFQIWFVILGKVIIGFPGSAVAFKCLAPAFFQADNSKLNGIVIGRIGVDLNPMLL